MRLVDDTVEASVRQVKAFVHAYLAQRLAEARLQVEGYGQRYADAMLAALDTQQRGARRACQSWLLFRCCQLCAGLPPCSPRWTRSSAVRVLLLARPFWCYQLCEACLSLLGAVSSAELACLFLDAVSSAGIPLFLLQAQS